jgi:hypothetical protein
MMKKQEQSQDKTEHLFRVIRRALLMIVKEIEKTYPGRGAE